MNIDTMTAEELRRAIAEAKGWRFESTGKRTFPSGEFHLYRVWTPWGSAGAEYTSRDDDMGFICDEASVPDWPTSIADAWALVEEMWEDFAELCPFGKGWRVTYDDGDEFEPKAYGETAPLAICRAYLAWRRAKVAPNATP